MRSLMRSLALALALALLLPATLAATQTITVLEALGCTDAFACNYDNAATADDGSCDYCSCDGVYAPSGPYNVDIDTIVDGIDGLTTYQVYVTLENADDFLSAVTGDVNLSLIHI